MCIISGAIALSTALATSIAAAASAAAGAASAGAAALGIGAGASTAALAAGGTAGTLAGTAAGASATVGTAAAMNAAIFGSAAGMTAASSGLSFGTVAAISAGTLGVGGALAGGVTGIVSGVQSAQAQADQADYMADIESRNAKMAARQAENIGLQGDQERGQLRNQMLQTRGTGRAEMAAGGVVLGRGSAADYEADIADAYDLDKRNLNYDIAQQQWVQRVDATNSSNQASLYRAQSSGYQRQGRVSLLSGMFGTAANTVNAGVSAYGVSKKVGWI